MIDLRGRGSRPRTLRFAPSGWAGPSLRHLRDLAALKVALEGAAAAGAHTELLDLRALVPLVLTIPRAAHQMVEHGSCEWVEDRNAGLGEEPSAQERVR